MNLDHFQVERLAEPLMASERARLAAQRERWSQFGARWPFWAALSVTLLIAMVAA
jgi:hypothetical protein